MKSIFFVPTILTASLLAGCRTPVDLKRADINFAKTYSAELEKKQVSESFDRVLNIARAVCLSNKDAKIVEWKVMNHQTWAEEYDVTRAVRNYEAQARGSNASNIPSRGFIEAIDETQQHKGFTCVLPSIYTPSAHDHIMNEVSYVSTQYGVETSASAPHDGMEMNIGLISTSYDDTKKISKFFQYETAHINLSNTDDEIRASILDAPAYHDRANLKQAQASYAKQPKSRVEDCPSPTEEQIQRMKLSIRTMADSCRHTGAHVTVGDLTVTCGFKVSSTSYYFKRENDCSFAFMENGALTGLAKIQANSFK